MEVLGQVKISDFANGNPDSRAPLATWLSVALAVNPRNFEELRSVFGTVSYIPKNLYCFNIGGNNYRLITAISFTLQAMTIEQIMTHADYDKWNKSRR